MRAVARVHGSSALSLSLRFYPERSERDGRSQLVDVEIANARRIRPASVASAISQLRDAIAPPNAAEM